MFGVNISGGAVLLLPIRHHYAGIFIVVGLLCVNIYRWPYLYSGAWGSVVVTALCY